MAAGRTVKSQSETSSFVAQDLYQIVWQSIHPSVILIMWLVTPISLSVVVVVAVKIIWYWAVTIWNLWLLNDVRYISTSKFHAVKFWCIFVYSFLITVVDVIALVIFDLTVHAGRCPMIMRLSRMRLKKQCRSSYHHTWSGRNAMQNCLCLCDIGNRRQHAYCCALLIWFCRIRTGGTRDHHPLSVSDGCICCRERKIVPYIWGAGQNPLQWKRGDL